MKYLKSYKLFESSIEDLEDNVRDILLELEDIGLQIEIDRTHKDVEDDTLQRRVKRTDVLVEVRIMRPFGAPDRVIPGVPQPPSGKYPGNLFFWYEIKDAIIRLNDWYYEYSGNEFTSFINSFGFYDYPFKMFNTGIEFGIGWYKPEDFNGIGDYISFSRLRIEMKL
jgi:hypothetical protein